MYSREEVEAMRGEGEGVGSVWGKIKKGAKTVGKGALKYNPVSLQIRAAKAIGKWSTKQMAAVAKRITSAIAYPLKRAIRPVVRKTALAVAKRNKRAVPTKADTREANKIVINGLKHGSFGAKTPLMKVAGFMLGYVGTGVSGMSGEEHRRGQRTWRAIRYGADMGDIAASDVAAVAATTAAVLLMTPLLIRMFTKKAAEGSAEEKPPEAAPSEDTSEARTSSPSEDAPEDEDSDVGSLFRGLY